LFAHLVKKGLSALTLERRLADEIIKAQEEEIAEMKALIIRLQSEK
jgi:uncharacterized protein (DUF305 family)